MMTIMRPAAIALLAVLPISALAEPAPPRLVQEVTLDIDRDGKPDRALLVQTADSPFVDLHIYLAAGTEPLDPSRRPTIIKPGITAEPIRAFESKAAGSLVITWGRGGSNDYETSLIIVHRRGTFLVGGLKMDWDTRTGMGSCDINYLTGKGTASRGLAKSKPIRALFKPVKLADWSDDRGPKACQK